MDDPATHEAKAVCADATVAGEIKALKQDVCDLKAKTTRPQTLWI